MTNKRDLERQARALRQKPGWDPARRVREDPLHALRAVDQSSRDARVYGDARDCPSCQQAQALHNDEGALCEAHLAAALGF